MANTRNRQPLPLGRSTITHILENPVYLGHTCNFKTRKHFKDKKSHYVDQDRWTFIYNTHEAIIDQDTFDNVQRLRANIRRYPDGWGEAHPLGGLLFCADCGSIMYVHRINNGKRIPQFTCSAYTKQPVGSRCPAQHRVNADAVMTLVQETLREIVRFSKEDEESFIRTVQQVVDIQQDNDRKGQEAKLKTCRTRMDELEKMICRIYEDNVLGKLPDSRYDMLNRQYSEEQATLKVEIAKLESEFVGREKNGKSAAKFIALVKKYQNFEELTAPMLIEFVDKILVHERNFKGRQDSPQTIEIYFNFIGQFSVHEEHKLTPEEIALEEEKESLRQKRHDICLRAKQSGAYDRYYAKSKAKKKAAMDAAKEVIRAEDRANGVYYLPKQNHAGIIITTQDSVNLAQEGAPYGKTGTEDS